MAGHLARNVFDLIHARTIPSKGTAIPYVTNLAKGKKCLTSDSARLDQNS
jgi:hypothetical protein